MAKIRHILQIFLLVLFCGCTSTSVERGIEEDTGKQETEKEPEKESENEEEPASDVFIIDNKRFNISTTKTNARSTTDSINAAIRKAKSEGFEKIKLTKGEYLISSKGNDRWGYPKDGIFVPSNTILDLTDATLILEPNDNEIYNMLIIEQAQNVTIIGGHLIGDRETHTYGTGSHEWGFGVRIICSQNITIKEMTIEGMTGDAIILSLYGSITGNEDNACRNVSISGCKLHNCRRQGISVIHASDVEISGNTIYNIHGTAPQFGIDIEPEVNYGCFARKISIHNNHISDCVGGISFHGGTDMEAHSNTIEGICLIAVYAQRVDIYNNTVTSPGYISAGKGSDKRPCQDICIPTEGERKNNCNTIVNQSIQTGNYTCK